MTQYEPIPDSTQAHVDRLVGARVGDALVLTRQAEGRFGTLYRAQAIATGKAVTLQALRTLREGNDEEARAANSIKCANIAEVLAFGELPDGRRYRVMEALEGESLDEELQRKGKFEPKEVVLVLQELAGVLQAAHAWMIPHGGLGLTSVLRVGGSLKVIDFGIVHGVKPEADLQALGALGFALLTGKELDGAPPPLGSGVPEWVDRVLRELLENRVPDATTAKRELGALLTTSAMQPALTQATPKKRSLLPPVAVLVVVFAVVGAFALIGPQAELPPPPEPDVLDELDELPEPDEPAPTQTEAQPTPSEPARAPTPGSRKTPRAVPSAQVLMEEISRLEKRLLKTSKQGDELDQAMFVLNKQRLRLTGNVSESDRRDVANQLRGWKRSYLR